MGQKRLRNLAIFGIEKENFEENYFDAVIEQFVFFVNCNM